VSEREGVANAGERLDGAVRQRVDRGLFVAESRGQGAPRVEMEGPMRAIHTPQFDIDEKALPLGAAMLAECALLALADLTHADK